MSASPEENGVEEQATLSCWRCELEIASDVAICPHCEAPNREGIEQSTCNSPRSAADPFKVLMWSYALFLTSTMVLALVTHMTFEEWSRSRTLLLILFFEMIDAVIVCTAVIMCRPNGQLKHDEDGNPRAAWFSYVFLLTPLLAVNFLYHHLLTDVLGIPIVEDTLTSKFDGLVLVTYCIQPAIIEELFCRGLAMGVLGRVVGTHSAVWISAIMFGLLHIGAPLSIPYLTLVGGYLGYARIHSKGLALPMLLHFAHNVFVIYWESIC